MGSRSNERTDTREPSSRSTDDLLSETEQLLSGTNADAAGADSSGERAVDSESSSEPRSSRLPSLPRLGALHRYFSPKAFIAFALLIGAGMTLGGMAIPVAGRMVGMFAVAFAVGLLTSKRRYLEITAASATIGGLAALANHAILAVAGSGRAVLAVGAGAALLACLVGYYFGRDLRNGLAQDIE
jgi:hypothetical protein